MHTPTRSAFSLAIIAALLATDVGAQPVSLEAWFQGPRLDEVTLSNDGQYLAMIVRDGDRSYVAVKNRTTRDPARPVIVPDPEQEIHPRQCGWTGPSRLVCRLTGYTAKRGDGKWVTRLMAVDANGANGRLLLDDEPAVVRRSDFNQGDTLADRLRVLAWNTGDGESMLVWGYLPGATGLSVGQVNSRTGALRILVKPRDPIGYFS